MAAGSSWVPCLQIPMADLDYYFKKKACFIIHPTSIIEINSLPHCSPFAQQESCFTGLLQPNPNLGISKESKDQEKEGPTIFLVNQFSFGPIKTWFLGCQHHDVDDDPVDSDFLHYYINFNSIWTQSIKPLILYR